MTFQDLYNKDVSKYVEVKGSGRYQASYLSWAFALKVLKENYPEAYTETVFYSGIPYLKTEVGYFVTTRIYLSLEDRKNSLGYDYTFPVLDNTYKAIKNPDVFHINTSIQRCLVKNIAVVTGLGLSLYSGEDIKDLSSFEPDNKQVLETKHEVTAPPEKPKAKTQTQYEILGVNEKIYNSFASAKEKGTSITEKIDNLKKAYDYYLPKASKPESKKALDDTLEYFTDMSNAGL
jgi:hypothetical protein